MFKFPFLKGLKSKKIRSLSKRSIEPQEIFLDQLAKKKEEEFGISERKMEVPLSRKVLQIFLFLVIAVIIVLFAKTFQLQVLEKDEFLAQAENNKYIINFIRAERGVIYDSKSNQLVFNRPSFDLILDKNKLPDLDSDRDEIFKKIAEIISRDFEELKKSIVENDDNLILIEENLEHQKVILLETKISELSGFEIQRNAIREYQEGDSFAHLIGYTGRINSDELKENPEIYSNLDYIGRIGLEKSYEEVLRKEPGKIRIERDALGNEISREITASPESGKSLVLHLDSDLQKEIERELEATLERIGAKRAVGIALNPKNGGVLALVSLPSFDNNIFSKDTDPAVLKELLDDKQEPLFNRAVSGRYPTGSTIKPLVASAALEEKIIDASKSINCEGKITIPHRYDPEIIYEMKDWTTHYATDLRKAIAESCNVFFYTIGGGYKNQEGLGPSKIKKYLELFGWEEKTGIDLPNENEGFIPSPGWKKEVKKENWWDGDTYNLAIGQGDILITPLEVVNAFAAIANRGTLYKPKIVKEIVDSEKNLIEEIKPEIIRENFISPENLEIVREGMRQAVTGYNAPQASSVLLNSLPVSSAAKTGTAQTAKDNYYHNWITVFAPYENPEIVLTIVIEDVWQARAVVLPTARQILDWYFKR